MIYLVKRIKGPPLLGRVIRQYPLLTRPFKWSPSAHIPFDYIRFRISKGFIYLFINIKKGHAKPPIFCFTVCFVSAIIGLSR